MLFSFRSALLQCTASARGTRKRQDTRAHTWKSSPNGKKGENKKGAAHHRKCRQTGAQRGHHARREQQQQVQRDKEGGESERTRRDPSRPLFQPFSCVSSSTLHPTPSVVLIVKDTNKSTELQRPSPPPIRHHPPHIYRCVCVCVCVCPGEKDERGVRRGRHEGATMSCRPNFSTPTHANARQRSRLALANSCSSLTA